MTLEEAHKYIVQDNEMVLERPNYFVVEEKYEDCYSTLFVDVTELTMGDESVIENIKNNPLVMKFKKKGEYHYLDTRFGSGLFFPAHNILGKENTESFVEQNDCHGNSMTASLIIGDVFSQCNPVVLTGVTTFSIGKPLLHSVCAFDTKKGRIIIDYTYNVAMSEELFLKLYNFKVLSQTKPVDIIKFIKLNRKYRDYLVSNNKEVKDSDCYGAYFLLAKEDCFRYINDVIDNKRDDDYLFLTETEEDFNRRLERLKKETNKKI